MGMGLVFRVASSTGAVTRELRRILEELGIECPVVTSLEAYNLGESDIVVVVGDDKTILKSIFELGNRGNPILGVSEDPTRGFLSQCTINELRSAIKTIMRGMYKVEENTRLAVKIDDEQPVPAVNEAAIFPHRSATLMEYTLSIDDEMIWRDYADGVIVATPLGSSAYSLSAGGSLIHHDASVFEIVPVNSIDVTRRALVVPDSSQVTIDGVSSRHGVEVIIDGLVRIPVKERIVITKNEVPCRFLRVDGPSSILSKIEKKIHLAEELLRIPPSAKLIIKILEYEGPLTYRDLVRRTMMPERTIRHALSVLISRRLVAKKPLLRDARQKLYYLPSHLSSTDSRERQAL